jgi:hypothetical protein
MRRVYPAVIPAVALLLVLAGCDAGNDPGIPSSLDFDAAVVAADGTLEDLRMMHGPGLGVPGVVFPPLENGRPNCPPVNDRFSCPPFERDGISYTREITYLDADGNPQDAFVEGSTASIHYLISVEGELSREWWTASVNRDRDLTVTGLPLDTDEVDDGVVTWNGTGTGSVERSRHTDGGEERTYTMESTFEISDVVIPYPRNEDSWPQSGTITRLMEITLVFGDETETKERMVVITFDGTQFATVTVGEDTFTVDLAERRFGPGRMHRRPGGPGHM